MRKKIRTQLILYALLPSLVCGWWCLSFKNSRHTAMALSDINVSREAAQPLSSLPLAALDRDQLHKALQGDFTLMAKLIAEWDVEAQILQSRNVTAIRRLPSRDFLRSQLLIREKMAAATPEFILDDTGEPFPLDGSYKKFLPQTFVAASFLLAAAMPEQIAALPQGMRDQTHLYSYERMKRVALDINRFNAERLYMVKPDIAFVANYSHPSTLQALEQQGVRYFTIKNIESLDEITSAFMRIGQLINRPLEAELLKLFMEASFLAIDNQMAALRYETPQQSSPQQFLYLNYYSQFSVPHAHTLTGHLLKRLGIDPIVQEHAGPSPEWKQTIDHEQIVNLQPDVMIISTTQAAAMQQLILNNSAFAGLPAVKNGQVYFVDEIAQESPSQYIVLAYYDLFDAMVKACRQERMLYERMLYVKGQAVHE
jgi:iron complex transport system substrate-binding protein